MKNKERTVVYSLLAVSIFLGLTRPLGTVVADNPPGEGTFSKLTIVGPDGKPAVVLDSDDGGGRLEVLDREAESRVSVGIDGKGSGVVSVQTAFRAHSGGIRVVTPSGETGVSLGATDGGSHIKTHGPGGKGSVSMHSLSTGEGCITIQGADYEPAIKIELSDQDERSIEVYGPDGNITGHLP